MPNKTPLDKLCEQRLGTVAKALIHNDFTVDIFEDMQSAVQFFKDSLLPEIAPTSAGVGGSETVTHSGVYDILREYPGLTFHNPYAHGLTPEQAQEERRQGLLADLFVTSSNALTMDGKLVNLDGYGNRVAGIAFGPKKVVLFIGRNKLCSDLESAMLRVKEIAAPANAMRLNRQTPCAKTGICLDCSSSQRVCGVWSITERVLPAGRIHVLLVNEDLGY